MLDKLKSYTLYLTPKLDNFEITFFEPQPFLANKKICALQIISNDILVKNDLGQDINSTIDRVNLTLVDLDNNVVIDDINATVFRQTLTSNFAYGGNIIKISPFIVNWQKSYITNTQGLITTDPLAFNFYYL